MFDDVEIKIKKHNAILFSRESECLQNLRGLICEQSHRTLVLWVFECLQIPLNEFMAEYPNETDVRDAYILSKEWAAGRVKMPVAKKAILDCHAVAKRLDSAYYIALCHAVGQGCSTVHVETHALGLVFYELTAIVVKNNYKNYSSEVARKLEYYTERLLWWQDNIEKLGDEYSWAGFLVRPGELNREKQLMLKKAEQTAGNFRIQPIL